MKLPDRGSSALSEIISRSLFHIQTSKLLTNRHRIGEQELCGPDYQLVCAFAEDVRLTPEEVLRRLLIPRSIQGRWNTKIENGRFKILAVDKENLPVSVIPSIEGLVVEGLVLRLAEDPADFDFSMFPLLKELAWGGNRLMQLDLSRIRQLTHLECDMNQLAELNLSHMANLKQLICWDNQLTELDLSQVPNLTMLDCGRNQLSQLDISQIRNLTALGCGGN